jgi:hypothetical protein
MILSTDSNEIMGTSADGDDTVEFVVVGTRYAIPAT